MRSQRRKNIFPPRLSLAAFATGLASILMPLLLAAGPIHFDVRVQSVPVELFQLPRKNLYAAGLSENGSDVIIIANGNTYAARVASSGKMTINTSIKTKTSDLVYANIARWIEVPLSPDVTDLERLHSFIDATLVKFGFQNPGTVPFLLKGRFKKTVSSAPKPGGTAELSRTAVEALMVGFFTKKTEGAGVELKSVIHALLEKPQAVGRINSLTIERDRVILYLPK